ncbi:hypothetical protein ACVQ90_11100 [Staphylococcus aureus]
MSMIVSTVMSNLGFYKALEQKELNLIKLKLATEYVVEEMHSGNYNLGGEQSGHMVIIDCEYNW